MVADGLTHVHRRDIILIHCGIHILAFAVHAIVVLVGPNIRGVIGDFQIKFLLALCRDNPGILHEIFGEKIAFGDP